MGAVVVRREVREGLAVEDLALAVALAGLALAPLGIPALELGQLHDRAAPWALLPLSLGQTLPLVLRRRAPAVALVVVGASFAVAQLLGADTRLAGLGLLVGLYSLGRHQRRRRWATVVAATSGYALLAVALASAGSPERPVDWVTFWVVLSAAWCAGTAVRSQRARQRQRERLRVQQAATETRALIARDLHDVVTHHVTAMVLQAESTAFAADGSLPEGIAATLGGIGASGRAALRDLRSLLDALDPVHADGVRREPAGLSSLVAGLHAAGYPITLDERPHPSLDAASASVLHDIARESVTNAMKHAPGLPVRVLVTAVDDGACVELTVENRLRTPSDAARAVGGRGLAIMAERIAAVGGTFHAGLDPAGTYRTTARLLTPGRGGNGTGTSGE